LQTISLYPILFLKKMQYLLPGFVTLQLEGLST